MNDPTEVSAPFLCGDCSHFTTVEPGAGYRHDTGRFGHCLAPKPEWAPKLSPLIEWSNPMAEVCECYRRKQFGN
jgi:hypothetical protein